MKRLFVFFMTLLFVIGCEEVKFEEKPQITLDPNQSSMLTLSDAGGSFDVIFTSVLSWTAEIVYSGDSKGWASLNKTNGSGGNTTEKIKLIVQNNDSESTRVVKLVITSETVSKEIVFTQEASKTEPGTGPEPPHPDTVFNVLDKSADVAAEGGTVKVTVQFNVDYECQIAADWIREVQTRSYYEKVHTFEIDPNPFAEPRSTTISFCGNGTCIPFVINQAAGEPVEEEPVFDVLAQEAEVEAEGGTVEVTVNTNLEYEYEIPVDWIEEIVTRSVEQKVHVFKILPNESESERTAEILFSANDRCIPYTITQKECKPVYKLEVDTKDISVDAVGTSSPITVNVFSDVVWTVSSDMYWCTISSTGGENNGTFDVSVLENTQPIPRLAKISVSSEEGLEHEISVIQLPVLTEDDDNNWQTAALFRKSLVAMFVNDYCSKCKNMVASISKAQEIMPDKIEGLVIPCREKILVCPESETLVSYHGIKSFPTGSIDFVNQFSNSSIDGAVSSIIDGVDAHESISGSFEVGVGWKSYMMEDHVVLDLSTYIKLSGTYKVTALLVEDDINGYNAVLRSSFSDVLGEEIRVVDRNNVKRFAYSTRVPADCNKENLRIVVYVRMRNKYDQEYVINASSEKVGVDNSLYLNTVDNDGGNEGLVQGDDILL